MADHADIASNTVEVCTAEAEARQRGKSAPERQPGYAEFDGFHCVDCNDEIPVLRLRWGRIRCVDCQKFLEETQEREAANRKVE